MKPAIISFCLAVSFAAGTLSQAQPAPTATAEADAVAEGVRRQAATIQMRKALAAAKEAQQKGYHFEATKQYVDCLNLIKKFGLDVEAESKQVVAGLIASRMQLAQNAQRIGDLTKADTEITSVLKLDSKNEAAQKFKKENDRLLQMQAGRVPSQEGVEKLADTEKMRIDRGTRVQNAKLLYEAGNIDESEKILKQVFREDPDDKAAYTYMMLIKERRYQEEVAKRDLNSRAAMVLVAKEWNPPVKRDYLPNPNPYARTNLIFTGKGRQGILGKLEHIRLNDVSYDDLPLSEVIKSLNDEARKRDQEKKGINFIMNANIDPPAAGGGGVDPATGLPIAAVAETVDLGTIKVKIAPALNDLSLAEVLDIIVKVAEKPIKYSVEDYGIVISSRTREAEALYPRRFKVDPNTFRQGLQSVVGLSFGGTSGGQGGGGGGGRGGGGGGGGNRGGGGGGGNRGGGNQGNNQGNNQGGNQSSSGGSEYVGVSLAGGQARGGQAGQAGQAGQPGQRAAGAAGGQGGQGGIAYLTVEEDTSLIGLSVRNFFLAAGVTLDPPKILFYNDRTGLLWVKATLSDLDTIEQAIQVLNVAPQQVTIKAKFAEVTQDDTKALGFDWFWGNTLMAGGSVGAQGGTAPSFGNPTASSSPANPSGIFPGPSGIVGAGALPPSATDNILTSGLRNSAGASAVATITGILTDPQFRVVIKALEQRGGVDLLSAPEVTTLSSRQTQIKVVDIKYIVTDLDLNQTSGGGGNGNNNNGNNGGGGGGVGSTVQAIAEPIELGPVLDVVPYVASDGYTIQMVIIPTLKEFLGYDLETGKIFTSSVQSVGIVAAPSSQIITPLPQFRLRQVATSAIVWDGQTVVLGGLISENVQKMKDKVPVLGDLPLLGRFFRSESTMTKKKNLLIFVSPTIIDPSGNRLHSEEEMPFAQQSIPPQKPIAQ